MTSTRPVVAVVQARMGSTRLPGKVLEPIGDTTLLGLLLQRLARSETVDQMVVATTTDPADDAVEAEAARHGADPVRGPVDDVLARFMLVVDRVQPSVVVRLTADCPFTDPALVDQVTSIVTSGAADLAGNGSDRYLRGFDVEACTAEALATASREATEAHQRVHVTPFLYEHPDRFRIVEVPWPVDHRHLRLTVDTPADLEVAREVYDRVVAPLTAGWRELASVLEHDPQLAARNARVRQKSVEEG